MERIFVSDLLASIFNSTGSISEIPAGWLISCWGWLAEGDAGKKRIQAYPLLKSKIATWPR